MFGSFSIGSEVSGKSKDATVDKNDTQRKNESLPHGTPFSFAPASLDIHRALQEEASQASDAEEGFSEENQQMVRSRFVIRFGHGSCFYSLLRVEGESEVAVRQFAQHLIDSRGVIGVTSDGEKVHAFPGVVILHVTRIKNVFE